VEAADGDSLLDALASHEVDAVLADIRMPRRSGVSALKALRQRGNFVPVILLTTFDDPQALKEGISAGAAENFFYTLNCGLSMLMTNRSVSAKYRAIHLAIATHSR
jgi:DNA-binding NarL/FixJ family response regulator